MSSTECNRGPRRKIVVQHHRGAGCVQSPTSGTGSHPPPPVLIEDVTVSGERKKPNAIRRIGPGKENLAIRYTAFSFLSPQSITFRYILEGYDSDWTAAWNAPGRPFTRVSARREVSF